MIEKNRDIKVKIQCGDKHFSITLKPVMFDKYRVKIGRSYSKKHGLITRTKAFDILRKWAVENG